MKQLKYLSSVIFPGLLILLLVNISWGIFIILLDITCGVRLQTSIPLFPVAFIAATLFIMLKAYRRQRAAFNSESEATFKAVRTVETVRTSDHQQAHPTILRSALIVNRKPIASSTSKGRI